jgi:hypothetical protein
VLSKHHAGAFVAKTASNWRIFPMSAALGLWPVNILTGMSDLSNRADHAD